ncbi:hypothetical protein C1H46_042257 [Malus baccata]|uniref:RING-type domain-containing protein n=1 Tax=Malus baccata TaxID=106549 RepID=A0A540KDA8_MALBA|nr:hypothetical protein C1H46_042257 [Malus baccata]
MENDDVKLGSAGGLKSNNNNSVGEQEQNPLSECEEGEGEEEVSSEPSQEEEVDPPSSPPVPQPSRTPFSNLSQVDADLALARTLQEQGSFGTPYHIPQAIPNKSVIGFRSLCLWIGKVVSYGGGWACVEYDPAVFSSDEAYARALQDAEDREMAARLMALARINDREVEDTEEHGGNSQDTWDEVDPDELSYEELLALAEVVGTESRGLSADNIASLPSVSYKTGSSQNGSNESCVICRLDYEDGENLTLLSCKHSYHSECINNWLTINKVCPVCSAEVSTSGNS